MKKCSINGCDKVSRARSYCLTHYERWKKGTDLNAPLRRKRVPGETRKSIVREWRYARMEKFRAMKSKPCRDCGNSFPPECMDFDHVRGTKLFAIGPAAGGSRSWSKIIEETMKCDLICANCHRIRTTARLRAKIAAAA